VDGECVVVSKNGCAARKKQTVKGEKGAVDGGTMGELKKKNK